MKNIWEIKDLQEYREIKKDMFSKHVAKFTKLENGNDCIIEFMIPGQREFWMRFIYIDGVLNINGDYGYAVFNWYNSSNHILAHLNFKNIGYVMSKCKAARDAEVYSFSVDLFNKEFDEFISERKEEGYIDEDFEINTYYIEDEYDVISFFKDNHDEFGDDLPHVEDMGTYLNERPYIWWHGLHSALEQLEEKGVFSV